MDPALIIIIEWLTDPVDVAWLAYSYQQASMKEAPIAQLIADALAFSGFEADARVRADAEPLLVNYLRDYGVKV
jgi:hypothetical protein